MVEAGDHLKLTTVAVHSLLGALVLSAAQSVERNNWKHEALLLAVVPVVACAGARWWVARK